MRSTIIASEAAFDAELTALASAKPAMAAVVEFVAEIRTGATTAPLPVVGGELAALMSNGLPAAEPARTAAPAPSRMRRSWRTLTAKVAAVTMISGGALAFAGAANALPGPVQAAVADAAGVVGITLHHPGETAHHAGEQAPTPAAGDHSSPTAATTGDDHSPAQSTDDHPTTGSPSNPATAPAPAQATGTETHHHNRGGETSTSGGTTAVDSATHEATETETEVQNETHEATETTVPGAVDVSNKPAQAGSTDATGGGGASKGGGGKVSTSH